MLWSCMLSVVDTLFTHFDSYGEEDKHSRMLRHFGKSPAPMYLIRASCWSKDEVISSAYATFILTQALPTHPLLCTDL